MWPNRETVRALIFLGLAGLLAGCSPAPAQTLGVRVGTPPPSAAEAGLIEHAAPHPSPSAAYQWLDIALEATARDVDRHSARPTIISRTLAIALTAMYDAWAAYDDKAVGTRLGSALRRPAAQRTQAHKEQCIRRTPLGSPNG